MAVQTLIKPVQEIGDMGKPEWQLRRSGAAPAIPVGKAQHYVSFPEYLQAIEQRHQAGQSSGGPVALRPVLTLHAGLVAALTE